MNLRRSLLLLLTFFVGLSAKAADSVPGEYIVKFKKRFSAQSILGQSVKPLLNGAMSVEESLMDSSSLYLVKQKGLFAMSETSILKNLKNDPRVEYAEPNYIWRLFNGPQKPPTAPDETPDIGGGRRVIPNDSYFKKQWSLYNFKQQLTDSRNRVISGSIAGLEAADSKASQGWRFEKGSKKIIVAVVDTGVDYNHPDLKDNMWSGIASNGRRVYGYNSISNTLDPYDDQGHGTHVAGTIGAVSNNGRGIAGVAWNVRIMGIKFISKKGSGTNANAIKGIDWAITNGADVMNHSWGGKGTSRALDDAFQRAENAGVVMVTAAGNNASSNDETSIYPANVKVASSISVASSTNHDKISGFSNYGLKQVELSAPGSDILSTTPGNTYGVKSGTSMASPHVAGAVALLLSQEPNLTPLQVRSRLIRSVSKRNSAEKTTISGGRLNIKKLLTGSF